MSWTCVILGYLRTACVLSAKSPSKAGGLAGVVTSRSYRQMLFARCGTSSRAKFPSRCEHVVREIAGVRG